MLGITATTVIPMNERVEITLDKATFLDWVQHQEGRYELVRGRVVMQQGGTRGHAYVAARITGLLMQRVDGSRWSVVAGDLAIDVGPSLRYPEILVECSSTDRRALSTEEPLVLVEVLSPSSIATDFGERANEYLALASLEAYVIAAQDAAHVWVWTRETAADGSRLFPTKPRLLDTRKATLAIPAVGFACTVAEIYDGIL